MTTANEPAAPVEEKANLQLNIRIGKTRKDRYTTAAGGKGKLSAWILSALDAASTAPEVTAGKVAEPSPEALPKPGTVTAPKIPKGMKIVLGADAGQSGFAQMTGMRPGRR